MKTQAFGLKKSKTLDSDSASWRFTKKFKASTPQEKVINTLIKLQRIQEEARKHFPTKKFNALKKDDKPQMQLIYLNKTAIFTKLHNMSHRSEAGKYRMVTC